MRLQSFSVVLGSVWIIGCAGDLENPERFAKNCADDPVVFVHETCGAGACHVADTTFGVVDFTSPGVTARLVDQSPTVSQVCTSDALMGEVLIDSVDPTMSFVLNKLTATPVCGSRMPLLADPLTPAEIECVATYVDMVIAGMGD